DDGAAGDVIGNRGPAGQRHVNLVARLQILQVAEDAALDVVVPVEHRVAAADGGGVGIVGHRVPLGDQHVAAGVDAPVEDRGVLDAESGDREVGDHLAGAGTRIVGARKGF